MINAEFRTARFSDLDNVLTIEHASFEGSICESRAVYEERLRIFPDGFCVTELEGKVVGFISSEIWQVDDTVKVHRFALGHSIGECHRINGNALYISSMGLMPEHRSQGIGRTMFENFLEHARFAFPYVESILLIVSDQWTKAVKIYQRNGFEEIMTIKDFFFYNTERPYHENGVVMRKNLIRQNRRGVCFEHSMESGLLL